MFCFSNCKNYNIGVTAINILATYIKSFAGIYFCFYDYKNCNAEVAAIGMLGAGAFYQINSSYFYFFGC